MNPTPHPAHAASWHQARALSYESAAALEPETVSIYESAGRVLAEDVLAMYDVPHYASSAMDGWAVAGDAPWQLTRTVPLRTGQAAGIVTGGVIPAGATGVLRSESGELRDGILVRGEGVSPDEPTPGQHIRKPGEEAHRGDSVLRAGTILNPARVAVAALCGRDSLLVFPRPRVSLVLTGDEVVESGIPAPGSVRDTFGPQLPTFVELLGGNCVSTVRVGDDRAVTITAIVEASTISEVIVTTGGTGSSAVDHLREALSELGATLIVDQVAMRPGRPSLLARLPNGSLIVCLPGNPLAAMVGVFALVQPLLAALGGRDAPAETRSVVGETLTGRAGTTLVVPYRTVDNAAVPGKWNGSGMLRGLADAAGLLLVPRDGLREGDSAEAVPLPWQL